jgi:hypothetical protein
MQHDMWAKSRAERPHLPFIGKPGINVELEGHSNALEYFELLYTSQVLEVVATNKRVCANVFIKHT